MKNLFSVLVFLCVCPFLWGQVSYFQEYNLLKKNDPIQVRALFQDVSGYIWIGSNKGLFRFDGLNKVRFTKADGLPDETISCITQDSLGRIWTGHKNGHLAFLDGQVFREFNPPEGLPSVEISKIHFGKKGTLWFSTLNDGLYYFKDNRLYRLDETDGMPDLFIYDIAEDEHGNIWAGTDGGIAVVKLQGNKAFIQTMNLASGLPDNIIRKILIQKDTAWIATEDKGIYKYLIRSKKSLAAQNHWAFGSLHDFLITHGKIWATSSEGLIVTNINTKQTQKINGIKAPTFLSKILEDREGNIWIGQQQGLVRCYGDYIQTINTQSECGISNVVALAVDRKNNLWFSNGEGLYKRSVDSLGIVLVKKQLLSTPYEKLPFISLYADDLGNIWAGTYGVGLLKINTATGSISHLNKELRNGNILGITGKGNEIWLATLGGGTQIINQANKLDIKNFGRTEGFESDYNYQIFIDSKGKKWFATDGKGALALDETGVHQYSDSLPSKVLYGFAEDQGENIWANVQGEGIFKFSHRKFDRVSSASFGENNISILSTSAFGDLVVMHDLGVGVFDLKSNEVRHFGQEYGLEEMKPNLNAYTQDQFGNLYFGTNHGIVKYSSTLHFLPGKPHTEFESLKNSNQWIPLQNNLEFKYDQNNIVINYTAFWFQNPQELTFSYILENYDKDWVQSRDRSVTYSSLPPGEYKFRLRASTTSDFSSQKEIALDFTINPPFWKRVWFYVLVAFTSVYAGYSIIRYRERKLIRDNHALEVKVRERYSEILKKNEEIRLQAEEIRSINENLEKIVHQRTEQLENKNKALEEAAFINAHNLRGPLASILGLISLMKALDLLKEKREYLQYLEESGKKLDKVVQSISMAIDKGDAPANNTSL